MRPEQRIGWYQQRVECMTAYVASLDDGSYEPATGPTALLPIGREDAVARIERFRREVVQAEADLRDAIRDETVPVSVRLLDEVLSMLSGHTAGDGSALAALREARRLSHYSPVA